MLKPKETLPHLTEFSPPSYGFDRLTSQEIDPSLLDQKARQALKQEQPRWDKTRQSLSDQVAQTIKSSRFSDTRPLFTNFTYQEKNLTWHLNRDKKPWVYKYLESTEEGQEDTPGGQSYRQAEELTDNDSGLYGLVAASVETELARGRLYTLFSETLCQAFGSQSPSQLAPKIEEVFLQGEIASATAIVGVHQRAELFPGLRFQDLTPVYQPDQLSQWVNHWQEKATRIQEKIKDNQTLNLEDIKMVEIVSHLFDDQKVLKELNKALRELPQVSEKTSKESPQAPRKMTKREQEIRQAIRAVEEKMEAVGPLRKRGLRQMRLNLLDKLHEHRVIQEARKSAVDNQPSDDIEKAIDRAFGSRKKDQ